MDKREKNKDLKNISKIQFDFWEMIRRFVNIVSFERGA